jgi:hypothetical protein
MHHNWNCARKKRNKAQVKRKKTYLCSGIPVDVVLIVVESGGERRGSKWSASAAFKLG